MGKLSSKSIEIKLIFDHLMSWGRRCLTQQTASLARQTLSDPAHSLSGRSDNRPAVRPSVRPAVRRAVRPSVRPYYYYYYYYYSYYYCSNSSSSTSTSSTSSTSRSASSDTTTTTSTTYLIPRQGPRGGTRVSSVSVVACAILLQLSMKLCAEGCGRLAATAPYY